MQATEREQLIHGNDNALIAAFREGDKEAFKYIYSLMFGWLMNYVKKIINSHEEAEDIVAETFYKLYEARTTIKDIPHIKYRLFFIGRNEAINCLRLKNRQRQTLRDLSYLQRGIDEQGEIEWVKALLFQDVLREVEKLPLQRKTVFCLYFFEQKETHEIAEIMQIERQTVINFKNKALNTLRQSGLKARWLLEGIP